MLPTKLHWKLLSILCSFRWFFLVTIDEHKNKANCQSYPFSIVYRFCFGFFLPFPFCSTSVYIYVCVGGLLVYSFNSILYIYIMYFSVVSAMVGGKKCVVNEAEHSYVYTLSIYKHYQIHTSITNGFSKYSYVFGIWHTILCSAPFNLSLFLSSLLLFAFCVDFHMNRIRRTYRFTITVTWMY